MNGKSKGLDRRTFLRGAASAAAGAAAIPVAAAAAQEAAKPAGPEVLGPGPVPFALKVNGKEHALTLEPRVTLLDALRLHCGVTGPKEVCDRGACGSCAVLLDGLPVASCMMLAIEAAGRTITTTEGLVGPDGKPHPLHEAFAKRDALQCGFCTPGMVVSCAGLLAHNPDPSADDVRDAVSGNICRCGTYPRVVQACRDAAAALRAPK
jgi:aerobic-type carbon monoxide dehydrogenase small subunit (CoxS/CutS family)